MFLPVSQFVVNYASLGQASGVDFFAAADRAAKRGTLSHALVSLAVLKGLYANQLMPSVKDLAQDTRLARHLIFGGLISLASGKDATYFYENAGGLATFATYSDEVVYAYGSLLDWADFHANVIADQPSKSMLGTATTLSKFLTEQGIW